MLVATYAGHPPPLWYRAARHEWMWIETSRPSERGRPMGLPLGLLADVNYEWTVAKPHAGYLVFL